MKYKITAVFFLIILAVSTGLNIYGNIAHLKPNYSDKDFSWSVFNDILNEIKENESQYIFGKTKLSFMNATVQGIMGKKCIEDPLLDVVKLKNGFLGYNYGYSEESAGTDNHKDYAKYSEKLSEFHSELKKSDIGLLYIQVAGRIPSDEFTPYAAITCKNDSGDEFIDFFDEDIRYIKTSEEIESANLDYYDLFYKTDHHWNADCGFFVSQKICEKLNYDVPKNITDIKSYSKKTIQNSFLGSIGRRVGDIYAGYDDFSVLYPNFETDLTVAVKDKPSRSGSFENTVIYNEYIPKENSGDWFAYSAFCGGDFGLQIVTNNNSDNNKKILIVRDSYGAAVSPYLALTCAELHIIDLRHYEGVSVLEYARQIAADDVLLLYNVTSINDTFFNLLSDVEK